MLIIFALAAAQGSNVAASSAAKGLSPSAPVRLPHGASIAMEGDSLVYGLDATSDDRLPPINGSQATRSAAPFPETFQSLSPDCGLVTNRGYPGDRSVDGLVRWQAGPPVDLALLMYGGNDALNASHASSGTVSVDTFTFVLNEMIERHHRAGTKVLIVSPPPLENPEADKAIQQFRDAAQTLAKAKGVPFLDLHALLRRRGNLWVDGVHMNVATNRLVAEALKNMITCAP